MNRERKIKVWYPAEKRMAGPFTPNEWCRRIPSNVEQVGIILDLAGIKESGGEIYEDDVCRYKDESGKEQIGKVTWYGYKWAIEAFDGDDEGNQDIELHPYDLKKVEVIGNIYLNPELLATEGEKA